VRDEPELDQLEREPLDPLEREPLDPLEREPLDPLEREPLKLCPPPGRADPTLGTAKIKSEARKSPAQDHHRLRFIPCEPRRAAR